MILLMLMAAIAIALPAYASLSPMSLGFPVWIQNSTNTALHQIDMNTTDMNVANLNFPVMSESGITGQTVTTTNFLQNSVFSSYSYPAAGIGVSGISGFWM